MRYLDQLKSYLNSALDRKYFLDKWIGDNSLVTLLKQNYELDFLNKSYLNRYIQIVYLQDYKFYHYTFHRLKNDKNIIVSRTFFYHFTKSDISPKFYTTKKEWQEIYDNFRILRCSDNQRMSIQRREISMNTNINLYSDDQQEDYKSNIITPQNFRRRLTITDTIGDYYNSPKAKILFNCKKAESIYNCLSRHVDHFNLILNNKICISIIANKAMIKDCEMSPSQTILMLNRMNTTSLPFYSSKRFL